MKTLYRFNKLLGRDGRMGSPLSPLPCEFATGELTDAAYGTKGLFAYDEFRACARSACTQSYFGVLTVVEPIGYAISLSGQIFAFNHEAQDIRRFWTRYQLQDLINEDDKLTAQSPHDPKVMLCQSLLTHTIVGVWIPTQHLLQVVSGYYHMANRQADAMGLNGTVRAVTEVSGFAWSAWKQA